jgi:uncharacterized protein YqgC (DUF456 family)
MNIWWTILAGVLMGGVSLFGIVLTLITLPGVWLMLAVAIGMELLFPVEPFSHWTIGVCAGVALAGEVFEFMASAVGAKKVGGGRSGAIGSVVGALAGAIVGTFAIPLPIIGSLAGAVLGAGAGALLAERGVGGKTWAHSAKIGGGAAAGRLAASLVKAALTAAIGVALTVAAVW